MPHHTTQANPARAEPQPPRVPSPADRLVQRLYEKYSAQLLGFARRRTGDHQLAEDIVQETFLRAWRHAATLSTDDGSILSWLYTVARNLVFDDARRRSARPPEIAADLATAWGPAVAVADPADAVISSIFLDGAMCSLAARHREVLVETFFNGRTVAEAGVALDVPVGTVKSRRFQALRVLRTSMDENSVGLGAVA